MMKIVLLVCLVQASIQATAGPTWTVNAFLNAGEHKPISGTSTAPSTIPTTQTFNTAFAVAPRVILSLEGYKQNAPCAGCQVGFKYTINTVTTAGFTGSIAIYGANIFYLLYTYMGVAYAATEYSTSYQLLTFSSGNLIDTASASRSLTQIFNNPAGEAFPSFPVNTIVSTIFLAGFKMNLGTTGTYINLTSRVESASTHSVTIGTRGDVQIFQVCYFRIAFDKTAIMQGYINIIDYMYIWGANSTQQVSPNPLPAGGFLYRNYMMGFNQISLPGATQVSDIMLQFHTTPQIIWASSSVVFNFVGTTYEYLWADIFHHRKRNCAVGTPYYNYQNQLCYDVCPARTFPVLATQYCQKCHYSCLTCTGTLSVNCSTCDSVGDFRGYNSTTSECLCLAGYFENNAGICPVCASPCVTCVTSASTCLTCDLSTQHRTLNSTGNTCICTNGYYETSLNTPLICLACDPTCITCSSSSTYCLTCDLATQHRTLNSTANTCPCTNGYYQTSINTPTICLSCHPTCITCQSSSTSCLTCDSTTQKRVLNVANNVCGCANAFYETSTNTPTVCLSCDPTCITCQSSATFCTSCDLVTQKRTLNATSNACICSDGFYQTSTNTPTICLACHPTCITCQSSSTYCLTCDSTTQKRVLNATSNVCGCTNGFYQTSTNTPTVCLSCHPTCITCLTSSTFCISCDSATQKRVLNTTSNVCGCTNGFYETSANTPTVCLSCDPTCITCSSSATFCLSCDPAHQRTLNTGSNVCQCNNGFYETSTNSPVVCLACNYQCVTCSSSSSCSSCDLATHHRQLNSNVSALCPCVAGYYDNGSNQTCLQCDVKCLTCSSSSTNCLSCDTTTRFLSGSTCSCNSGTQESPSVYGQCIPSPTPAATICGNGIVESGEACDDFNIESNDGCSSTCQVEANHACEQYSNGNGTSLCYYSKPLTMVIESVIKELNDNKITITIKIEALLCNLVKLKQYLDSLVAIDLGSSRRLLIKQKARQLASTIIYISSANFVITDTANYQGYLNLVLEYTESISTLQNKRLSFLSSNAQQSTLSKSYFFATPTSNIILQDPYNKIPMNFYKAESYQSAIGLSYVFLVIIVLNFLFFIVLVFMRKSVVPVESILVFQFAYFCVAGQKDVELAVASLAYFGKFSLGININFIKSVVLTQNENYQICSKMGKIYQECSSLNNINITFYLAIVLFFFYLGCVIFKFKKQRDLDNKEKEVVNEDPEVSARQRENLSDENGEFREQEQSQTGSNQSNKPIIYELPLKIKNASFICLEFSFGMIFLTAIEYLLTAVNQNDLLKTASIVWLAIVGVFFAALWVVWFYSYPLEQLSYVQILKKRLEKISVEKFAYLGLFLFLTVWGVLLAIAPGIAAYSVLIVWCFFWLYLSVRKQIYQSRLHKLRSFLNQVITIIIALLFIVLEYVPNDGMGLGYSIAILLLLLGSLICNVVLFIYDAYLERRNKKLNEDVNQFKQVEDQFKNYSSRKSHASEQIKEKSIWDDKVRNNPQLKLFQMTAPKRELLIDSTEIKETARSKANQLKSFRKLLKFQNGPLPDEKRTQLLSQVRKLNGEVKLEQDSQYRGL